MASLVLLMRSFSFVLPRNQAHIFNIDAAAAASSAFSESAGDDDASILDARWTHQREIMEDMGLQEPRVCVCLV